LQIVIFLSRGIFLASFHSCRRKSGAAPSQKLRCSTSSMTYRASSASALLRAPNPPFFSYNGCSWIIDPQFFKTIRFSKNHSPQWRVILLNILEILLESVSGAVVIYQHRRRTSQAPMQFVIQRELFIRGALAGFNSDSSSCWQIFRSLEDSRETLLQSL